MHVDADIVPLHHVDGAGVHAHSHSEHPLRQSLLGGGGRAERLHGAVERSEEGIPLRPELHPVVRGDRLAQHLQMLRQGLPIGLGSELLEQARRTLDIGEQKGDRPGRQRTPHGRHHVTRRQVARRRCGGGERPPSRQPTADSRQ
jgi:hypothetical protein